jgi:hypothetical protein
MAENNITPVNNDQPVNQGRVVQGADGAIALKVEQTKLPEFWGYKSKDSITANKFVKRIDNMAQAKNWADSIAFSKLSMALRRSANTRLDSQVYKGGHRKMIDHQTNLQGWIRCGVWWQAHPQWIGIPCNVKPWENVRDYFGCLNKTCQVFSDAYKSYTNNPEEPAQDDNGNVPITEVRKYKDECDDNLLQFILLNLFRAGLPNDLHRVINLQNMQEIKLDTAVNLTTIEAWSKEEAHFCRIYATAEDEQDQVEEQPQVDAFWSQSTPFRPQQKKYSNQRKQTYSSCQNDGSSKPKFVSDFVPRTRQQLSAQQTNVHFLPETGSPWGGLQKEGQSQKAMLWCYHWVNFLTKDQLRGSNWCIQYHFRYPHNGFSLMSLMDPYIKLQPSFLK